MEAYLRSRASLFRSILAHISHSNKPPIVQRRSPLVERHLAARHQNWALRVPNDALGDATYEPALYGPQPPAAHNDQAEPALLLTELEYLFVRVPHLVLPALRPHRASSRPSPGSHPRSQYERKNSAPHLERCGSPLCSRCEARAAPSR